MSTEFPNIALTFYINERGIEVKFPTSELRDDYIKAELKNIDCQRAYYDYQAERTIEDRKRSASKLGHTRYNFYKGWASKNHLSDTPSRPNEPRVA